MTRSPGRWVPDRGKNRYGFPLTIFSNTSKRFPDLSYFFPMTVSMYLRLTKIPESIENPILEINSVTFETKVKFWDRNFQPGQGTLVYHACKKTVKSIKNYVSVSEHRLDLSDRVHTLPHWLTHQLHRS